MFDKCHQFYLLGPEYGWRWIPLSYAVKFSDAIETHSLGRGTDNEDGLSWNNWIIEESEESQPVSQLNIVKRRCKMTAPSRFIWINI